MLLGLHDHGHTRYFGKYAGVVVDNEDPDKLGRLKVQVPAIFGEEMGVWARPCLPFAVFFVPDVDARVWVEFEAGDPSYPIWTGCFFTADAPPKAADLSPPQNRAIQTPSGHMIELVDKDGECRITITHKNAGSKLELADDGVVTLTCKGEQTLTLAGEMATLENKEGTKLELRGAQATITATAINLGSGAAEPAVLGNALSQLWMVMMMHTHPTALGPSGPPIGIQPMGPQHLSMAVKVK